MYGLDPYFIIQDLTAPDFIGFRHGTPL